MIRFLTHLDYVQLKTEDIVIVPHLYFLGMASHVHKASTYFPIATILCEFTWQRTADSKITPPEAYYIMDYFINVLMIDIWVLILISIIRIVIIFGAHFLLQNLYNALTSKLVNHVYPYIFDIFF